MENCGIDMDIEPSYRLRNAYVAIRGIRRLKICHVIALRLFFGCLVATLAVAEGAQSRRLLVGRFGTEGGESLSSQPSTSNSVDRVTVRGLLPLSSLSTPSLDSLFSPSRPPPLETPPQDSEWQSSQKLFNMSSPLIVNGGMMVVRSHPFVTDWDRNSGPYNLVPDLVVSPTNNELYYIHWLFCNSTGIYSSCPGPDGANPIMEDSADDPHYWAMWIKRVNLSEADHGSKPQDEQSELFFRWPFGPTEGKYFAPTAMALSRDNTHLVFIAQNITANDPDSSEIESAIALLSLADRSLSFVPLPFTASSLAVSSSGSLAYFSAVRDGQYIWSIAVNESGTPVPGSSPTGVEKAFSIAREEKLHSLESIASRTVDYEEDAIEPAADDIVFQSQSISSGGHCMYYSPLTLFGQEPMVGIVGFDPLPSGSSTLSRLIASYYFEADKSGGRSMCEIIRDVITTEDGCHVLAAVGCDTYGVVLSVKLASPCTHAIAVEKILEYHGGQLISLALHRDDGDKLSLFMGSDDGKIFKAELNTSEIGVCE